MPSFHIPAASYHPRSIPTVTYTRLNEHYRGAVEWARLILRFASVETRHGKALGTTMLFDVNAVFEDFVRKRCAKNWVSPLASAQRGERV